MPIIISILICVKLHMAARLLWLQASKGFIGHVVFAYQGDGDLAAIGTAEIIHAANRGENITFIFVNNAVYGMTSGQMAPNDPAQTENRYHAIRARSINSGYPIRVCELLAVLDGSSYLERVSLSSRKTSARQKGH